MGFARRTFACCLAVTAMVIPAGCGDDDDTASGASETSTDQSVAQAASADTNAVDTTAVGTSAGGDSTSAAPASSSSSVADEAFDPEGVIKIAVDLAAGGGINFDPLVRSPAFYPQLQPIYDTLLHRTPDGSIEPGLAESVEIVDTRTLEVVLRPGLVFSDGTPLDAEALGTSLLRNAQSDSPGFRAEIFDVESVEAVDDVTALLHLSAETAGGVLDMMSFPETFLVSPKALADGVDFATAPVGAGPFVLESLEPGVVARLRKNPSYYGADDIKLAGIDFVHVDAGSPAQVNGLLTGEIDLALVNDLLQEQALSGQSNIETNISTGNTYGMIYWCKSKPPLDDVRVRQALSFATDRNAIVDVVQGGHGTPAWGIWPEGHPWYDAEHEDVYTYNPERARELLAEAGYPDGFALDSFFSAGTAQRTAELLQSQWAEVGVELNLVSTNDYVKDFFIDARAPMWISGWAGAGNRRITRLYGEGQVSNVCAYNDPELNSLAAELKKVDSLSPEGIELWNQMQDIVVEDVLSMQLAWNPILHAWNSDRVGGVQMVEAVTGSPSFDVWTLYIKQG